MLWSYSSSHVTRLFFIRCFNSNVLSCESVTRGAMAACIDVSTFHLPKPVFFSLESPHERSQSSQMGVEIDVYIPKLQAKAPLLLKIYKMCTYCIYTSIVYIHLQCTIYIYVYLYTYIHTHSHISYLYTYIHTYIHIYICIRKCTYIHAVEYR